MLKDVSRAFPPVSLLLPAEALAPRQARAALAAALGEYLAAESADDVALVVGELVANSVRHAALGPTSRVGVDLGLIGGHVWIAVSDTGSRLLPHKVPREPDTPGGLGLLVVDRLARSWGVARDGVGRTRVWCELATDRPRVRASAQGVGEWPDSYSPHPA